MDHIALAALMKAKNIKPADIGAAPSGFGLGEKAAPTTAWKYAKGAGFLRSSNGSPDGAQWWGITCARDSGAGTQVAFKNENSILIEAKRIYKTDSYGNVSGEWEYVNPPMLPGVEYLTTERWKGKAVYTKLIDLPIEADEINDEGRLEIYPLASGVDTLVSAEYREVEGTLWLDGRLKDLYIENGDVRIVIYDLFYEDPESLPEATLLLKYTKTE